MIKQMFNSCTRRGIISPSPRLFIMITNFKRWSYISFHMREELAHISVFFFFLLFLFCKIFHGQTSNLVIFFLDHLSILMHQLVLLDHSRAQKVFRSSSYSSCFNAVDPFRQICTLANSYSDEIDLFFGECNYTFKNTLYNVLYYSITMPGFPALNRPPVLLLLFTQLFILFLLCFFSLYRYQLSWCSLFSLFLSIRLRLRLSLYRRRYSTSLINWMKITLTVLQVLYFRVLPLLSLLANQKNFNI